MEIMDSLGATHLAQTRVIFNGWTTILTTNAFSLFIQPVSHILHASTYIALTIHFLRRFQTLHFHLLFETTTYRSFKHSMAYSPSPHIASLAVAGSSSRFNRLSPSPPFQQPLSKRDKKRNVMENRLAEISSSFAENRDHLYRKQLQVLQADMNYIQAARLYDNVPLDEIGDEGPEEPNTSAAASTAGSLRNAHQAYLNGHTRLEAPYKTGPQTAEFIQEINDAMEQRDADLTTLVVCKNCIRPQP